MVDCGRTGISANDVNGNKTMLSRLSSPHTCTSFTPHSKQIATATMRHSYGVKIGIYPHGSARNATSEFKNTFMKASSWHRTHFNSRFINIQPGLGVDVVVKFDRHFDLRSYLGVYLYIGVRTSNDCLKAIDNRQSFLLDKKKLKFGVSHSFPGVSLWSSPVNVNPDRLLKWKAPEPDRK